MSRETLQNSNIGRI